MQEKFNSFFTKNNGQFVEVEDPNAYAQCMDLAFAWCDFINIPHSSISHYYAYQVWSQPLDMTLQYFDFIPNTPKGLPQVGDLIVFSNKLGVAGHISIATGNKTDTNTFESFDQNWGTPKSSHLVEHNYDAVLGFLRPKQTPVNVTINDQTRFDFGEPYGEIELGTARSMLVAKDAKIDELNKQVGLDAMQIGSLQSRVDETEIANQNLISENEDLKRTKEIPVESKVPRFIRVFFGDNI